MLYNEFVATLRPPNSRRHRARPALCWTLASSAQGVAGGLAESQSVANELESPSGPVNGLSAQTR